MKPIIWLADIQAAICEVMPVDWDQVMGKSRWAENTLAREVGTYLARDLTTHSYPEIALWMGKRSHSTFIDAHNRIKVKIKSDAELRSTVERVRMSAVGRATERQLKNLRRIP